MDKHSYVVGWLSKPVLILDGMMVGDMFLVMQSE
jgi:hypothetical protein